MFQTNYDILDILIQTRQDFFNLSRDELVFKIEHENNKIELINDVKNFIFSNRFTVNFFNILSYINYHVKAETNINAHLFNELKALMERNLNEENVNYYWLSKSFEEVCQYNFDANKFLKYIETNGTYNKDVIDKLEFVSLSKEQQIKILISLIVTLKLKNVIVLHKLSKTFINFDIIKSEYNNFYIYSDFINNEKESEDNYTDLKTFKNDIKQTDIINEEQANNINRERLITITNDGNTYTQVRKPISTRVILNNKILSISFWLEYKEKRVNKFMIEYDKFSHLFKNTSFETKFYLLERINEHKELCNLVQTTVHADVKESLYKFIIHKNKIIRYFFDILDKDDRRDCNIAYNSLIKKINSLNIEKINNIFCNYEFNKVESKLKSIVNDKNNVVFFVFDIKKAFYSLNLDNVNEKISKFLKDKDDTIVLFSILFRFIKLISKTIKHNYLPITSYSQFIFKLYFLSLFNNVKSCNFLTFVDDFVIYGKKDEVYNTFDEIKHILMENNLSISYFNIYDKLFTNSVTILKRELEFNKEERIELFEKYDKYINSKKKKKQFITSITFGLRDDMNEVDEVVKTINLDCPELIFHMLKNINENEKKVKINNKIEDKRYCSICYDNRKNCCLIPCGHMFCRICINMLLIKRCPYCNLPYKESLNLYDI